MSISNSTVLLAYSLYALPLDQVHPRKVNAYAITDIERLAESSESSPPDPNNQMELPKLVCFGLPGS